MTNRVKFQIMGMNILFLIKFQKSFGKYVPIHYL